MSQSKQFKKVKLYRTLKVVFYFLGLPLFLFAVFCTAIKFMGQDPFVGTASVTPNLGFFIGYERFITSPALFGIWCAFGVWAFISICHIILAKTVKSRRARMFAVLAIVLVVMLGGTFIMDAVFESKIDKMIQNAPAGVTIQDYKSQLSYYSHVSYARKPNDLTKSLKEKVQLLEKVYNVEWEGIDKSGVSGNIANKPVDYLNIISDPDENGDVEVGVDISFVQKEDGSGYELNVDENGYLVGDGVKTETVEGRQLVRIAPNGKGELVINGRVFSHYFCATRTAMNGEKVNVWYAKDMQPANTTYDGKVSHHTTDGVYGKALYNESGLISDGWVFSFDNVLAILQDYYEGQSMLAEISDGDMKDIKEQAAEIRDAYYKGEQALPSTIDEESGEGQYVDPWVKALYEQEVQFTENFSLTRGELEYLLSNVGLLLGDNHLFDWVFLSENVTGLLSGIGGLLDMSGLGDVIAPAIDNLANGTFNLGQFIKDPATMSTVIEWVRKLSGKEDPNYEINDIYIVLVYKSQDKENAIFKKDHLYLGLFRDNGSGKIDATEEGKLIDIDFDDGLLEGGDDGEYNFDLDRLSAFLNNALTAVLKNFNINLNSGILNTILGLVLKDIDVNGETYKGLVISGISIPLLNSEGQFAIDINDILTGLLQNWYTYQSPTIKPIWEFYDEIYGSDELKEKALYLAKYERALYEATTYGSMIGSTLIGDSLGSGTYGSSFGLGDLTSVRQLISDLSYQRTYFPLYSFRDMMLAFSGLVLLFYFLSFFAAEKEELYANGHLLGKETKADLAKELLSAPDQPDPTASGDEKTEPQDEQTQNIEQTAPLDPTLQFAELAPLPASGAPIVINGYGEAPAGAQPIFVEIPVAPMGQTVAVDPNAVMANQAGEQVILTQAPVTEQTLGIAPVGAEQTPLSVPVGTGEAAALPADQNNSGEVK